MVVQLHPRPGYALHAPALAALAALAALGLGCSDGNGGFRDGGLHADVASALDADAGGSADAQLPDVVRADAPDAGGAADASDAGPVCTGTGADPYPGITAPGDYTDPPGCGSPPCPGVFGAFSATPNAGSTVAQVSGHVSGAGACRFVVVNSQCGVEEGTLGLEPDSGNFSGPVPLFCGTNLVKVICSAGTSSRIRVVSLPGRMCDGDDLRLTLTWDASVIDGELHLIRAPAHINDAANDCTWTTCIPPRVLDWGVAGDVTDDPVKDVDNVSASGTEHITLTRAPAGLYYVMSEHWNPGGQPGTMSVQINTRGGAPIVRTIATISAHWVWYVGTIEFPGGVFTPSDAMSPPHTGPLTDCSALGSWTSPGCGLPIPQ